jgi:hypothetical protein
MDSLSELAAAICLLILVYQQQIYNFLSHYLTSRQSSVVVCKTPTAETARIGKSAIQETESVAGVTLISSSLCSQYTQETPREFHVCNSDDDETISDMSTVVHGNKPQGRSLADASRLSYVHTHRGSCPPGVTGATLRLRERLGRHVSHETIKRPLYKDWRSVNEPRSMTIKMPTKARVDKEM